VPGQHFCQLYETEDGAATDAVLLSQPFSNFYVSFHLPALDLSVARREVEYAIQAPYAIDSLEVDIEQPLRSTDFSVTPSGGKVSERKGFSHVGYTLSDIAKGKDTVFLLSYLKDDPQPSVDIKYAGMSGPRVWGSPYETQRKAKTVVYGVLGTGIAAALGGLLWMVRLRRRKRA